MTILDLPLISQFRRNHGLEHASLNILAQRFPARRMAGLTIPGGFLVLGDIATQDLREAVVQALVRMNNGERHLALHAGCGTNHVVSGILAGLLAWLGMLGARSMRQKAERLPLVFALATLGLMAGQTLGPIVQKRITTSGDPQALTIVDVFPLGLGRLTLHRVLTRG